MNVEQKLALHCNNILYCACSLDVTCLRLVINNFAVEEDKIDSSTYSLRLKNAEFMNVCGIAKE